MLRADAPQGMRKRSAGALRIECVELNPFRDLAGQLLYGFSIDPLLFGRLDCHRKLSCQIVPRFGSTRDCEFSSTDFILSNWERIEATVQRRQEDLVDAIWTVRCFELDMNAKLPLK